MAKSSLLSRVLGGLLLVLLFAAARGADAKGLKVLYSFSGGSDGGWPTSGLIMDAGGNLYGTTYGGGVVNNSICRGGNTNYTCGVVFKLSQGGAESVLYTFCTQGNCADGADPASGLVADQAGDFYGTTMIGGANDSGTVFELAAGGTETVLHSFCSEQNCADGGYPVGGLAADRAGDLYGAAGTGGNDSAGVIFEIAPNGTYTVLYSFTGGSDGGSPWAPLLIDKAGNLYGTSAGGGAINANCPNGCGTVFELNRKGAESVLYRFCSQNDCRDGSGPNPGVTADKSGNLYGTTFSGGAHGYGSVFEVTPFTVRKSRGARTATFPISALPRTAKAIFTAGLRRVWAIRSGEIFSSSIRPENFRRYRDLTRKKRPAAPLPVLLCCCMGAISMRRQLRVRPVPDQ